VILERALAIGNPNASLLAEIRAALAEALVELNHTPERARTLAQQAREDFLAADMKKEAAEVERLQARLGSAGRPSARGASQP
jgi:hypothetical protein